MHCHATDDNYRMELADEESNPRISDKDKEEAKNNRQVKSQLFGSFRETFG